MNDSIPSGKVSSKADLCVPGGCASRAVSHQAAAKSCRRSLRLCGRPTPAGTIPAIIVFALAGIALLGVEASAGNIASQATVSASANPDSAPAVVDGQVPAAGSRDDAGQSWVLGSASAELPATLTFSWERDTPLSTLAYYGRTTWGFHHFENYEIYLDDATDPVVKGTFRKGHGPQLVRKSVRQERLLGRRRIPSASSST